MKDNKDVVIDYQTSPALYHEGMRVEVLNEKKSCTQGEIVAALEKGLLKECDLCVMHVLYIQHYMTRYTLTENIRYDNTIPLEHKRRNYKQMLAKLVRHGIVLRYSLVWEDADKTYSTPCFYMLSRHAYEYIGKTYRYGILMKPILYLEYNVLPNVREILESAIFNQLHVQLLRCHRQVLSNYYINLAIGGYKKHCNIRGVYCFYTDKVPSRKMNLVVIPVRGQRGWMESLDNQIQSIEAYSKKENALFREPFYLFLCENGSHARSVDAFVMKRYSQIPHLFIIDQSLVDGDIMGKMFSVKEVPDGYQLILQELNL